MGDAMTARVLLSGEDWAALVLAIWWMVTAPVRDE